MAAKRTDMDRLQELVRLHRLGRGSRAVAKLLGMGPNTERQYRSALIASGLLDGDPAELPALEMLKAAVLEHAPPRPAPQQQSSIEDWRPDVEDLLGRKLGPRAILDRLRLEHADFTGKIGAVKRLVRRIERERGVRPEDVAIVVETEPGQVAQVDFGYAGHFYDPREGRLRRAWVFVMVLAHSRHMFCRLVFDQKTATWIRLHEEAFRELGGVPETIVPDNLKAAVVLAAFSVDGPTALNRSYRELARHYGFIVDPTPVYQPKKKGKVESAVKYVKRNGLAGRDEQDIDEAQSALARWVVEIAGEREHGTTGRKPLRVFEQEEQPALLPLPATRFEPVEWKKTRVHEDSHVHFDKRLYSVPWRHTGKEVWVRATAATVAVYFDDDRIATHSRRGRSPYSTRDEHLPDRRAPWRHRSRGYWEERADRIGVDVGQFVRDTFDSDDVHSQLRVVQAVVTHLEQFPPERANAACRRARYYGNLTYRGVRDILRQGLDLAPLPSDGAAAPDWEKPPRFARDLRELALSPGGEA